MTLPVDLASWQRLQVGPDGRRLKADGILGPKTAWALALEELPHWRQTLVLAGLRYVGLTETSINRGPEIDAWLTACNAPLGQPWCAAYLSWALRAAGIECREAAVKALVAKFPATESVLPGDIGYVLHHDGTGHCGVVTGVSAQLVSLAEGNSGNAVRVGWRSTESLRFCRPMGQPLPGVWEGLQSLGSASG